MGRKGMNEADNFSLAVIDEIQKDMQASGMSNAEIIKRAKISQDYFYTRMRGEKPFNTNDVSRIAEVIGVDPMKIFMRASTTTKLTDPDLMSEEEKAQIVINKLAAGDVSLAANRDENKEAERDTYPDAGA